MGIIFSTSLHKTTTTTNHHIFILSGQSNMSGRGGVTHHHWDHIIPDDCKPDPSTIHRLTANLTWETAQDPLHADIDTSKTCGVGPGMPFANAIKDYVTGVIDLVPCAIGGTSIGKWGKGGMLYENMVKRAKAAMSSSGGEVKALVWYQGESDTSSKRVAEGYKVSMESLIRNVRSDLGLPVIQVGFGLKWVGSEWVRVRTGSALLLVFSTWYTGFKLRLHIPGPRNALNAVSVAIASGEGKYVEVVREARKAIDLPNVVCVDAKGLELKEDKIHLTTAAQVELGHMLADAYLAHFG
ncbi:putative carbohydrate esterase At4g34215 [Bidens hawaiensis]|uniref:putative carbohydrate esterase At4g34215 n=1 Tax=Bidens hawaiensis TaxID=980011 RepID=UPI00404B48AE